MPNKKQNKTEYVKSCSISLRPSEHTRYKEHAKKNRLSFSQMLRVLFEEDITNEHEAKSLSDACKRDKLRAERIKKQITTKS